MPGGAIKRCVCCPTFSAEGRGGGAGLLRSCNTQIKSALQKKLTDPFQPYSAAGLRECSEPRKNIKRVTSGERGKGPNELLRARSIALCPWNGQVREEEGQLWSSF